MIPFFLNMTIMIIAAFFVAHHGMWIEVIYCLGHIMWSILFRGPVQTSLNLISGFLLLCAPPALGVFYVISVILRYCLSQRVLYKVVASERTPVIKFPVLFNCELSKRLLMKDKEIAWLDDYIEPHYADCGDRTGVNFTMHPLPGKPKVTKEELIDLFTNFDCRSPLHRFHAVSETVEDDFIDEYAIRIGINRKRNVRVRRCVITEFRRCIHTYQSSDFNSMWGRFARQFDRFMIDGRNADPDFMDRHEYVCMVLFTQYTLNQARLVRETMNAAQVHQSRSMHVQEMSNRRLARFQRSQRQSAIESVLKFFLFLYIAFLGLAPVAQILFDQFTVWWSMAFD